ncbi:dsDNA nuclease domain-containing protein [Caulobacter flavus]|uniref:dsDNA nuclease domain-containing protein n=1 Tax=Caulobacter flavus TaxID=1679497 RepID=UPI0013DE2916|nr:dsDNA nuclease domain-containing protein [Caulobacter flavus]
MGGLSDAGGVAARLGFKYQDHVAAMFVLEMIDDRRIMQVECETSDDITLLHRRGAETFPEYVQVKSTDRDSKWTFKEITDRDSASKARPTSLAEKSLLTDKAGGNARFRIVARRSVNATAAALLEPMDRRNPAGAIDALASKVLAKHRTTRSDMGNDLGYWTRNAYWHVLPGVDHVELKNLQAISTMAEAAGANPTNSHVKAIYRDLLTIVDAAAVATRKQPELKIITRTVAVAWWEEHLSETNAAQTKTSKPYRTKGDRFFAEIHRVDEDFRRSSSGYDARYERKVWRSKQLARHLADWVPELTLKASELVEITPLNMRAKFEAGLKVVKAERALDVGNLLAETLLHAVLRHWFGSEPVPCKLFHRSTHGDKVTKNAHLVHGENGDELWIGRTHLFEDQDPAPLFAHISAELSDALDTELLVEERDIILQLREAFMATSDEDDVFPHREVTTITFHDGLKAGQKPLTQYERETGTFRIDYPSEIEFGSGKEMTRHIHWLRDTMGTLAAGAFVIRDVEAWMTRLGADENAFGRSVALGDMLTLSRNVFGYDPSFSLAAWSAPDDQTYPPERTTPWRVKERAPEPSAEKVMKFAEGVSPEDMFDKTTLRHDQRGVLSPIETPLWDAAKWRGTMFGQYPDMPPILALGYTNPQYGEQIFDGWKARWGEVDKNDDLRVAIITGLCRRNPSHYSIIIGPNPLRQTNGRKLVTMLSRHQRMEPASLDNLNGFLERYYAYNAYFLTTAHMSANPDFDPKLFIQKSNLVVRPAWQIGPNDPDISVLRDGDDPIIPPDVADPPIRRAMAWDRELKSKRPRR